jgi:hypothetical protein
VVDNVKMNLEEIGWDVWTGIIRLRICASGELAVMNLLVS